MLGYTSYIMPTPVYVPHPPDDEKDNACLSPYTPRSTHGMAAAYLKRLELPIGHAQNLEKGHPFLGVVSLSPNAVVDNDPAVVPSLPKDPSEVPRLLALRHLHLRNLCLDGLPTPEAKTGAHAPARGSDT